MHRGNDRKIFFWSDLHLCHEKDFILEPRGFACGKSAKESLRNRWNDKITNNDTIFLLGDNIVGAGPNGKNELKDFLHSVNFRTVFLMPGNHPSGFSALLDECFERKENADEFLTFRYDLTSEKMILLIPNYFELSVDHQLIIMSHYPLLSWNKMGKGAWMLYGHVHDNLKKTPWIRDNYFKGKNIDLSVEATPEPLEFAEIQKIMNQKSKKLPSF